MKEYLYLLGHRPHVFRQLPMAQSLYLTQFSLGINSQKLSLSIQGTVKESIKDIVKNDLLYKRQCKSFNTMYVEKQKGHCKTVITRQ